MLNIVKYVGLLVLGDLLEQYPKLVAQHRDLILSCAEDPDLSIRIRALDLVVVLVRVSIITIMQYY
jgi:AP-3 complex subunit delta-1